MLLITVLGITGVVGFVTFLIVGFLEDWGVGSVVLGFIFIPLLLVFFGVLAHWSIRSHKIDFLNARLGTHYTHEEAFWSGELIEKIMYNEQQLASERQNNTQEVIIKEK